MTGKDQLVAALKQYSDNQGELARQGVFRVMELDKDVDATFSEISRWLANIPGLKVELVDGGQQPVFQTVFNTKHLKISLANHVVQFNPIVSDTELWFSIVGLANQDLFMNADFDVSARANGVKSLTFDADLLCKQLARLVGNSD